MDVKSKENSYEKFLLHYYGYSHVSPEYPKGQIGTCPVEIVRKDGKITVTITEPEDMVTTSVTNRIEHIATKLYHYCLINEDAAAIRWRQHEVRDLGGRESVCDVEMVWDGEQYTEPTWLNRQVIQPFRTK